MEERSVKDVLTREDGLDYEIINPAEEFSRFFLAYVEAKKVLQRAETPLAAEVLLIFLLTLHKLSVLLVDTVIGQVLVSFILAIICVLIVGLSGKPAQSLMIDVDPQRIDA